MHCSGLRHIPYIGLPATSSLWAGLQRYPRRRDECLQEASLCTCVASENGAVLRHGNKFVLAVVQQACRVRIPALNLDFPVVGGSLCLGDGLRVDEFSFPDHENAIADSLDIGKDVTAQEDRPASRPLFDDDVGDELPP